MNAKQNRLSVFEMQLIMHQYLNLKGIKPYPCINDWKRIDINGVETYVGNKAYIIIIIDKQWDVTDVESYSSKIKETVTKYLESEGFVGQIYHTVVLYGFHQKDIPPEQ